MTDANDATGPRGALADHLRTFLDDEHFATIATIDPDGMPRQAVVWYTLDGEDLVLNSAMGRRWPANLLRDPRISIAIADRNDGYRWVGLSAGCAWCATRRSHRETSLPWPVAIMPTTRPRPSG